MKKFVSLAGIAALALTPLAAHAEKATEGKMVYGANGQRIGAAYHVNADGSVQIILDGTLVTIAASDISVKDGKVISAKNKADLLK